MWFFFLSVFNYQSDVQGCTIFSFFFSNSFPVFYLSHVLFLIPSVVYDTIGYDKQQQII